LTSTGQNGSLAGLKQALGSGKAVSPRKPPWESEVKKITANRRKGKKLTKKPLPQVLNLSKKGPHHADIVKVIAALRSDK
jgi:hypothetical protein